MGNQQATLVELGWLAGIIDGEGYLGIQVDKKAGYVTPSIAVCNTDEQIVLKTKQILDKLEAVTYCRVENGLHNPKAKVAYRVQTKHQGSLIRILEAIGNLLTGNKFERGKLLLEFCQSRKENFVHGSHIKSQYTEKELELIEKMLPLQRKGASETIRRMQLQKSEILKEQRQRIHKMALKERFVCDNCGKEIITSRSRRSYHKHIFCNLDCRYEFQRKTPYIYQPSLVTAKI